MSKLKIGVKKIEHMAIFHSKEDIHLLIYHFCNTIDELDLKESKKEYIKEYINIKKGSGVIRSLFAFWKKGKK